jgi:hypothetical protein
MTIKDSQPSPLRRPIYKDLPKDTLLRRAEGAEALTELGFQTSAATLSTLAVRGGGPQFRLYGRFPLYRLDDLLVWAASRLTGPVASNSEAAAARLRAREVA